MRKYDADRVCPQCGKDKPSTDYKKGEDAACDPVHLIDRKCARCGYCWVEAALGLTDPPKPPSDD